MYRRASQTKFLLIASLAACGAPEQNPTNLSAIVDDAGDRLDVALPIERLVSLVPSVTDAVVEMGLADRLVGRTRYDDHPSIATVPSVGGGVDPSLETVVALDPEVVIGWRSGGYRSLRDRLSASGVEYYAASIEDTTDVYRTLGRLGTLLGAAGAADRVATALRDTLTAVARESFGTRPTVFYAILGDPPRTAGRETFIGQLIGIAGGRSVLGGGDLWPQVSLEAVVAADPDVIIVPVYEGQVEPAAALRARAGWRGLTAVREGRVIGIPAELVARPGPQLGRAARRLRQEISSVWEDQ